MHPTYEQGKAPQNEEEARRDLVNYLRRVKTKRNSELKFVTALLQQNPQDKALQKLKKYLSAV